MEIIYGIHSIKAAIENPSREGLCLYGTDKGLSELKKSCKLPENIKRMDPHRLQQEAEKLCEAEGRTYSRAPSQVFLTAESLPAIDPQSFLSNFTHTNGKRIIVLDQVTDVHNGAAIMRTASFFGVDAVVTTEKSSFGNSPTFFRIASGAAEFVPIYRCSSLPKFLGKLNQEYNHLVGLCERSEGAVENTGTTQKNIFLILGAEDTGLSHAVRRLLPNTFSLKSQGDIQSLNVSVASALAMETVFGLKP